MNTEQAFADWANRHITPEMRRTAGEWHDGPGSALYRLWASSFRDDVKMRPGDYQSLETEANLALKHLQPELEKWRPELEGIKKFAGDARQVILLLGTMKTYAEQLINVGVYDQEINGVVQGAVYAARDERNRQRSQIDD